MSLHCSSRACQQLSASFRCDELLFCDCHMHIHFSRVFWLLSLCLSANMTGCCSPCSSRDVGINLRCASSQFNTVSQVKRSSPLPAQRTLQPVSLYAVFILQNHCAVPPAARVVWARWPSLLLSWKISEVIPVNSLEISDPLIKETGVQAFPVANVYYTTPLLPYSCTCWKVRRMAFGWLLLVVSNSLCLSEYIINCLQVQGNNLEEICIWQIFPGRWLFLHRK